MNKIKLRMGLPQAQQWEWELESCEYSTPPLVYCVGRRCQLQKAYNSIYWWQRCAHHHLHSVCVTLVVENEVLSHQDATNLRVLEVITFLFWSVYVYEKFIWGSKLNIINSFEFDVLHNLTFCRYVRHLAVSMCSLALKWNRLVCACLRFMGILHLNCGYNFFISHLF